MNQNLIQINNNCGVVSDENGSLSLISKESDSYDFEEILLKENDLEDLNLGLSNFKKKLSDNKQKTIFGEITNVALAGMIILIYIALHSVLPLEILISILVISYLPFKAMNLLLHGTRIGRYKEKRRLTIDIEKIELEIPILEKELSEIKEKSKYKVSVSTVDKPKTSVEEIEPEISLSMDSYISEGHNKVRVLSLSKKRK